MVAKRKPYKSKLSQARKAGRSPRKNAKSTINKMSGVLLGTNKALRDINAFNKGTILDRLVRRETGKLASMGLGSMFFKFFK